jgi:hypothetical protein
VLVNRRAGSATTSSDRGVTQPWLVTGGNLVVFGSDADDLVDGVTDTNRLVDLFAFRLDTAEMRAVSVDDSTGGAATTARQSYAPGWYSYFDRPVPAATPDGRFVVYTNYSGFGESLAIRRALEPPLPPPTPKPPLRPPPDFSNPPTTSGTPSLSAPSSRRGYWMVSSRGAVYAFGDAPWLGNAPTATAVDIEPAPSGDGYWVLDAAGRVFPFGGAARLGDAALRPGERAVSLSATADGGGYWVFTDHGRALAFGAAPFLGDMSGRALNAPVLGSVVTPSGGGYWMVAADGGIFSFGDARFHGSMGGTPLNRPVMSMAPTPDGAGYWLVASDGGIFAFDAPFYGSAGQLRLNQPVAGLVPGRAG